VSISNNDSACTADEIENRGSCCPAGSNCRWINMYRPERAWGYAPHTTNVLVHDFEPGILYELRMNDTNYPVSGPLSGDIGLFVRDVMETTWYNVLARQSRE